MFCSVLMASLQQENFNIAKNELKMNNKMNSQKDDNDILDEAGENKNK